MSRRGKTLYGQIGWLFLVIVGITTATHLYIFYRYWNGMNILLEQRLHWGVAQELVQEVTTAAGGNLKREWLEERLFWYGTVNPRLEIYLLDETGNVVARSLPDSVSSHVAIEPVRQFVSVRERPMKAILGENPNSWHRHPCTFSAAAFTLDGKTHYFYVVLQSERFLQTFHALADFTSIGGGGLLFAATVLSASLVGLLLFYLLTRHFRRMTSVVREFADGNYDRRVPVTSDDELGLHARAFNRMADKIADTIDALARTDRLRRELVANVSHDIANPLAAVRGNIQRVIEHEETFSPQARKEHLHAVMVGIDRIVRLSRELLELSRLDSVDGPPKMSQVQIADLITEEIVPRFIQSAEDKGLRLEAQVPEGVRSVPANVDMLERVIANLVENAILYTDPGGGVFVRLIPSSASIRLEISDNGIGISEADLPRIFDRFVRGHNTTVPGTGLGLAIAKRMLSLHSVELHVKSKLGEGTTFWFDLPMTSQTAEASV